MHIKREKNITSNKFVNLIVLSINPQNYELVCVINLQLLSSSIKKSINKQLHIHTYAVKTNLES